MENKHCIFPFQYTNQFGTTAVYTNCTNADRNYFGRNNQAWCATAVDEEANYQDWSALQDNPSLRAEGICGLGCTFPAGKNYSFTRCKDVSKVLKNYSLTCVISINKNAVNLTLGVHCGSIFYRDSCSECPTYRCYSDCKKDTNSKCVGRGKKEGISTFFR